MRRIGVLTSGGDAPGMNAAVRAVVRAAAARGVEVVGYLHGWQGVIDGETVALDSKSVGGIISQGGTVLRSARSAEFKTREGRRAAYATLTKGEVDGLAVLGGDGSLAGARALHDEYGFPVVGIPGSIDNDIPGTDYSIGFDTAVNTALEAIDKIRDTAYSHERVFVIEVMGRANGFIALEVALASGAEAVLLPEVPYRIATICDDLKRAHVRGKRSSIIVVAEGAARAADVKEWIQEKTGFEARYLVLGHMQRGGSPTAFDRVLALRLGALAANRLASGYSGEMVGVMGGKLVCHSLSYVLSHERTIDAERLLLVESMAQ